MAIMNNQNAEDTQRFLSLQNPWFFASREVIREDKKLRELEKQVYQWHPTILEEISFEPGVFVLRGPRQIGKTTLAKLLIKKLLLEKQVHKDTILYYSCDDLRDYRDLNNLLFHFFDLQQKPSERFYIFLDEISFVKEWQRSIKAFVEGSNGEKIFFFLTGSSTIDLEYSEERLPGRRGAYRHDRLLLPMDFREFTQLTAPKLITEDPKKQILLLPELRVNLNKYLLTGGFPKAINDVVNNGESLSQEIYDIYTAWVLGDLHKFGRSEIFLNNILASLLKHETSSFSFHSLSEESGVISHLTVQDYLLMLEKMFVLFTIDAFSLPEKRTLRKKNHKSYFLDPFIKTCLTTNALGLSESVGSFWREETQKENFWQKMAESLTAARLKRNFSRIYWGSIGDREIDFVVFKENHYSFFETKYAQKILPGDFKYFFAKMPKEKLTVISKNDFFEANNLRVVPLEIFLLENPCDLN